MRTMLMGRTSAFAHFAGFGRRARADDAPADDEKKDAKSKAADGDDDDQEDKDKTSKGSKAADGDDDDQKSKSKADDGDDDTRCADDDAPKQYPDDDDDQKSKSKAADGEDDDEEEMKGKSAAAGARRRERARCAAIFAHPAAAENPQLACSLAFETTLTRKEARALLASQVGATAPRRTVGAGRDGRNPDLGVGGGAPSGKQAIDALWDKALVKAGVPAKS